MAHLVGFERLRRLLQLGVKQTCRGRRHFGTE